MFWKKQSGISYYKIYRIKYTAVWQDVRDLQLTSTNYRSISHTEYQHIVTIPVSAICQLKAVAESRHEESSTFRADCDLIQCGAWCNGCTLLCESRGNGS
jgi:hypothetical protein